MDWGRHTFEDQFFPKAILKGTKLNLTVTFKRPTYPCARVESSWIE